MININDYPKIIKETAVFPKTVEDFSLAYLTLGLFDEISEVVDKSYANASKEELIKEVGDVCWYACGICDVVGLDFIKIITNLKETTQNPFDLLGKVKKYYRDGKELVPEEIEAILNAVLYHVVDKFDVTEILTINYNKLIQRRENNTINGNGDNR